MDNTAILSLAAQNANMSTVDRLVNIYWALRQVLVFQVPGEIVEIGCNAGRTTVFLQMMNLALQGGRRLCAFDSFKGLPAPGPQDAYLQKGDCETTPIALQATFDQWRMPYPEVHAGWIEDTLASHLPERIAFAYIDVDFYGPTLTALKEVWPRVAAGGIVLVDDYGDKGRNPNSWEGLPGVRQACDRYFEADTSMTSMLAGQSDLSMLCAQKPPRHDPRAEICISGENRTWPLRGAAR